MEEKIQPGAVLLSDQIKRYVKEFDLIVPFNPDNLKPASYQLSVGDEYAIGGKLKKLEGKGDKIEISPFNVAIIQTNEKIKMPIDLIARWNIRVTLAYQGLLWVGGPQVDPGYVGHLYCPIYNLSNESVIFVNVGPLFPNRVGISFPTPLKSIVNHLLNIWTPHIC